MAPRLSNYVSVSDLCRAARMPVHVAVRLINALRLPHGVTDGQDIYLTKGRAKRVMTHLLWMAEQRDEARRVERARRSTSNRYKVYFIRAGEFVKIGFAAEPQLRLDRLQPGCPFELELLFMESGGAAREAELHNTFARFHHRGEWFRIDGELASYIAASEKSRETPAIERFDDELFQAMEGLSKTEA